MTNISITETSWKVTLNIMIHIQPVLGLFEENSSSDYLPHPFHLQHTQVTLSLMSSLLFIRLRITPRSQSRPKAQYVIWAFIPTSIIRETLVMFFVFQNILSN